MKWNRLYTPDPPAAAGGGSNGAGDGGAGHGAGGEGSPAPAPVPYERFQQVVGERNKLKTDHDALAQREKDWQAQQQTLTSERDQARAAALRLRVAVSAGLPVEFAERLQGKDEAELQADAAKMVTFLKPTTPGVPPPPGGGTPARIDLSNMTPAQIREKKADVLRQARGGT